MVAATLCVSTISLRSSARLTARRPARTTCSTPCRAGDGQVDRISDGACKAGLSNLPVKVCCRSKQVARPSKVVSGAAAVVLSAAAALQLVASPPAGTIGSRQMGGCKNCLVMSFWLCRCNRNTNRHVCPAPAFRHKKQDWSGNRHDLGIHLTCHQELQLLAVLCTAA